ncbi:MAG: NUDIX hydrolase [Bacteroidetes bacterium]|nr:MAG: NUDIX hydrolase [Bacteroidota bacterium]
MNELPEYTGGNPWKMLKSELVYDSPWISLSKHDVLNPNGNPGTYSVTHFKNIAIGVLALDEENNTWLVGQYRYPLDQYTWEIPEGGGKREIDPLESAKRELLEETGITAQKWTKIQEMYLSNSATDEFCILYLAQDLSFGEAEPEDTEDLRVIKVAFTDAYRWVCEGKLTDALTVTAILKVKLMMDEKSGIQ